MAKKWQEIRCELHADKAGVIWDLLLYVPTVGFLLLWGLKLWYAGNETQGMMAYGLLFLGFFFLMAGGSRIGKRMLWLPGAPIWMDIDRSRIKLGLKGGEEVTLIKDVRYYPDHAGKSFGLTGMDQHGAKQQFVLHWKQFEEKDYERVKRALEPYAV